MFNIDIYHETVTVAEARRDAHGASTTARSVQSDSDTVDFNRAAGANFELRTHVPSKGAWKRSKL